MTRPVRLQLSRRKGFDLQAWSREVNGLPAVSVARPTKWGNPFPVCKDRTPERAVFQFHSEWIDALAHPLGSVVLRSELHELRNRNLACWCALPKEGEPDICHAAILLELANAPIAGTKE